MTAVEFDFEKKEERPIAPADARSACDAGRFCWLDLDQQVDADGARTALTALGVPEIAIAEALGPDVDGRHDLYDECLHIAFTSAVYHDGLQVSSHVDLIIGEQYIASVRRGPVEFIEQVRRIYRKDFQKFAKSGGFLLYEYWDQLIESYRKTFRALDKRTEEVQEEIFGTVDDGIFTRAAAVQRDMLTLRKIMLAAREVLHEIVTRRSVFVRESSVPSLERLAAALERLVADLTVERESLAETLNLYMGIVAHRTNKIVNRLTVLSTVFLPLTFLAGIYGMNFENMPELKWEYSYAIFWVVIISIASLLLYFMKVRKWW